MQLADRFYDSEALALMTDALGAAWASTRSHHEPDEDALLAAMAKEIMTAVSAGERDPGRLKFAALDAVNSPSKRYEYF
jgi:hypothetical protein